MKKFKIYGKKDALFFTVVEAENQTDALLKVGAELRTWIPEENNNTTNGEDLQIMGNPKEV